MTEDFHIHRTAAVEHVFERNVVDKVLREVLVGICVGRIIAAYYNFEPVVEKRLRHFVAVARGCGSGAVEGFVVLVDAERDVDAADVVRRPRVELRGEERIEGVAGEIGVAFRSAGAGVDVVEKHVHRLVGALVGRHGGEFVLHRYVVVGCEVEGHSHVLQSACHVENDIEIHQTGILTLLRDVRLELIHRRDVERGIHHIAAEGYV